MLIPVLLTVLAAAWVPSPDASDQDGVVTTAPATNALLDAAAAPVAPPVARPQETTPHGLSTDQQIAQWLAARAPGPAPEPDSPMWRDDRQPHGEISVGVGTNGYRDYSAAVSLPIGESGRLDISVRQSENDPYRYRYGRGAGYDPYFTDSGYAFAGPAAPGAAVDYERKPSRLSPRSHRAAEE